jgi:transcription elongation GreA/GreB family factor
LDKWKAKYSRKLEAMNKRALIKKIIARLTDELAVYFRAANSSRAEATHEQNKAEDKYDTRGLSRQAAEIESAIAEFEKLAVRKFGDGEAIGPGVLVELEHGGEHSFYFIGPRAGGTEVVHEKREILVITPQSPLGEQLLGKKQGDQPQLTLGGAKQAARIVSVE